MLTWDQDLAYRRMLDLAYYTEKPLPGDRKELYAALRVSNPEEKAAVEFVLKKFWRHPGGRASGYVQHRVRKELANYRQYIAKQSNAGKQSVLKRNAGSTQAKLAFNPPSPSPPPLKPNPLPPYVSAAAGTEKPAPLPPASGGSPSNDARAKGAEPHVAYIERYGELIEVQLGRRTRFSRSILDGTEGQIAQYLVEHLNGKGFPSRIVPKG